MISYQVGASLIPGRAHIEPSVHYSYALGDHVVQVVVSPLGIEEQHDVLFGNLDLAIVPGPILLTLVFRFSTRPWNAAHFSWWSVPAHSRILPPQLQPTDMVPLTVVLVDGHANLISGLPQYVMPYPFAAQLHEAIREQTAHPFKESQRDYECELRDRDLVSGALLRRATARCTLHPTQA